MSITLNTDNLKGFVEESELSALLPRIKKAHDDLHNKTGLGNDYVGWVDLPSRIAEKGISDLEALANEVQSTSDAIVSIGIGGSYLGIRSTIDALGGKTKIPLYYAGHHMSSDEMHNLLETIKDKRVTVVVISKSGTTTEPALAFRIIKQNLEQRYSAQEMQRRIICVTDEKKGALRKIADQTGYRTFVIPDDVGGRFSVLTPVGLVPLALAGVDVRSMINGARKAEKEYAVADLTNPAYRYAAARYCLYKKGKLIEVMSSFYPGMGHVMEWWKQLFGESEGKGGQGIFPASTILSTDLHSMGQLMQDGVRNIFETFVMLEGVKHRIIVPEDKENVDNFNCVAGKDLDYVNKQAYKATAMAHLEGGVPNMTITLTKADAEHIGQLYYFFEKAVGISGYLLGVNPFDQPGVEAYKSKMFALLGRK